jgi:hypothetical protein
MPNLHAGVRGPAAVEQKSPDINFSYQQAGSERTIQKYPCGTRVVWGGTSWTDRNRVVSTELVSLLLIGGAHLKISRNGSGSWLSGFQCDRRSVGGGEAGQKTRSSAGDDCGRGLSNQVGVSQCWCPGAVYVPWTKLSGTQVRVVRVTPPGRGREIHIISFTSFISLS